MQVKPLAEPVPLYTFFIAAILVTGIVYGIRLTIRSNALMEYRREQFRKIRLHAKLPPGTPIPTHIFFVYMFRNYSLQAIRKQFTLALIAVLATSAVALPIAFLWVHNAGMDVGYKGMMTFVLVLFDAAVMLPFIKTPIPRRLLAIFKPVKKPVKADPTDRIPIRNLRNPDGPAENSTRSSVPSSGVMKKSMWRTLLAGAVGLFSPKRQKKMVDTESGVAVANSPSDRPMQVARPSADRPQEESGSEDLELSSESGSEDYVRGRKEYKRGRKGERPRVGTENGRASNEGSGAQKGKRRAEVVWV
ncbi:hypothetical protein P154DRAFT_578390 [Amniculicola lignicola CBS 123094]|uniref:Uncharacterized protein n=1 Tax=Amniculicola lignicola CBS 123094 TaxID=1392246 RepID=A0A6A5W8Z7_9PLEO|nr:hypothetical protein P154DRAFT_578390 [Amniculicola lignicola CBS 123094]